MRHYVATDFIRRRIWLGGGDFCTGTGERRLWRLTLGSICWRGLLSDPDMILFNISL